MTPQLLRDEAHHFIQPLKAPFAALVGGFAGLELTHDQLDTSLWLAGGVFVVTTLVLRTIIFFEFRTHEKKEQRLYEAILATSYSFDSVVTALRRDVEAATKASEQHAAKQAEMDAALRAQDGRLRAIEGSPLVQRLLARNPVEEPKP